MLGLKEGRREVRVCGEDLGFRGVAAAAAVIACWLCSCVGCVFM